MTTATVPGWDATHQNLPHAPGGQQGAGYTTGTAGIAWQPADWDARPHAVRIDQDASAGDSTADVLDVENGAATPADCPGWVNRARASYKTSVRPGQRQPAVYVNRSNVTLVANALASAGITGVGIWLADWNLSEAQAAAEIQNASGPYPVIAVQYSDQGGKGAYDLDVFSRDWLDATAGPHQGLHWHVFDGRTTLGDIARNRSYPSTLAWLEAQRKLQGANAERMASEAVPPKGAQWVSVNP